MTETTKPLQPWQQFRNQIKEADQAARLSDGDEEGEGRPYRVSGGGDGNPYPASPSMRQSGGWNGPIATANRIRERTAKI